MLATISETLLYGLAGIVLVGGTVAFYSMIERHPGRIWEWQQDERETGQTKERRSAQEEDAEQ